MNSILSLAATVVAWFYIPYSMCIWFNSHLKAVTKESIKKFGMPSISKDEKAYITLGCEQNIRSDGRSKLLLVSFHINKWYNGAFTCEI